MMNAVNFGAGLFNVLMAFVPSGLWWFDAAQGIVGGIGIGFSIGQSLK